MIVFFMIVLFIEKVDDSFSMDNYQLLETLVNSKYLVAYPLNLEQVLLFSFQVIIALYVMSLHIYNYM